MKLIICEICKEEKKGYKNLCSACYQRKRCENPLYIEKRRKQRNESYRRTHGYPVDHEFPKSQPNCKLCNKELNSKNRWSVDTCNPCGKKEYRRKNPEIVKKERKYALEKTRKKNGLPLDHPYLIARPGEGSREANGYRSIYKPGHHNRKNKAGRLLEHTWVMSQHLGRPLFKGENVHHINGDKMDNRIENLELWNRSQPPGQRVEDKIKFYKEFLEQYGYKITKE